jgi:hypothetical protein
MPYKYVISNSFHQYSYLHFQLYKAEITNITVRNPYGIKNWKGGQAI